MDCTVLLMLKSTQLSSLADDENVSKMMFDHADLERSKFYFKMLQILRILNNGPDDIKNCLDSIPAFWFDTLLRRFLNVYCDALDIQEIQIYWTRLRAMALDKFNVLEQRTKAKKSEIESLRDGVSAKSSSIIACCRMLIMMVSSCSTRLPSAKHSRPDVQTRTF